MSDATRDGRWRTPVARTLTVVGVLLVLVSIAANYVERQALGDDFEETARQLVADPAIQQQVAATMTEQLFANVDVEAELRARLPEEQQALAGPVAGGLRPLSERVARALLDRPRVQELWVTATSVAQQQVVRVLDDEARFLETEGGVVALDLRPLLAELTEALPIVPNLDERLPEDAGIVRLFEAEELETAQTATRVLRFVAAWIWVLALLAWVGAVAIARNRRIEIRAVAIGFVVVGVLVLLVRRLAGGYLVDELATTSTQETAVERTWSILTRLLADAGWAAIAVGLIALVGVWLVGTSDRSASARGWLAPALRRPEIAFGGAGLLFVLLLLWGPISYLERPTTILAFAVLAAMGVEALRRTAARDIPAASSAPGARQPFGLRRRPPSQADELERLVRLHDAGGLTDEEFEVGKARVLSAAGTRSAEDTAAHEGGGG